MKWMSTLTLMASLFATSALQSPPVYSVNEDKTGCWEWIRKRPANAETSETETSETTESDSRTKKTSWKSKWFACKEKGSEQKNANLAEKKGSSTSKDPEENTEKRKSISGNKGK